MSRLMLSPWAFGAVAAAGITREDLAARIPDGHALLGEVPHPHGRRQGPYRFTLTNIWTAAFRSATAGSVADVPRALDELLGTVEVGA